MWELTSSPTLAAALEPASTAALTLPTSPLHSTVISPPPIGIVFTRFTFAAFTIASLASTLPTYPFVSIIPNASLICSVQSCCRFKNSHFKLAPCVGLQVAGVALVRVDVHLQF